MEVKRQICATWSKSQVSILEKFGLKVSEGFNNIYINEDDLYYKLEPLFDEWKVYNVRGYSYSKQDILDAKFCILSGCNVGGYPMPDGDNGYLDLTYNTESYCVFCGKVGSQKDAFRIKKIPKHKIFQLTWIYNELFVDIEVYHRIFKKFGLNFREVKLFKVDKPINNIVQLVIPESNDDLDLQNYNSQMCPMCGTTKFQSQPQGFFPVIKNPSQHIYKSKEIFGDGGAANKKIFISGELRDLLIKEKIMKYYWFIPCK